MKYRQERESHILELSKDEIIMLIATVHEGLECLRKKAASGEVLANAKLENASTLVSELSKKIIDS